MTKHRTLTIVAGFFFLLVVGAGVASGAGRTPAGSVSEALQGKVRIKVEGDRQEGRFIMSGAISDRGRYLDTGGGGLIGVRILFGAKGTIWIKVGELKPAPCQCNWRITGGTKGYAELRGRGQESGFYRGQTVNVTMSGTVLR
jgi:hypothetical protein